VKQLIALRANLHHRQPRRAPKTEASSSRVTEADGGPDLTLPGKTADSQLATTVRKRGRKPLPKSIPTPSETRLLELLDQPRRGRELAPMLGVTHERVRQMIAALLERDFIRSGDPEYPTSIIARRNDTSLLLRLEQERLLNRFPDSKATTLGRITNLSHTPRATIDAIAETLRAAGLIEKTGEAAHGVLYRLTAAGAGHWQRSATVIQADGPPPPALPVRSDRVRNVLADLECNGATRTRDIGLRLGIPQPSINALMQYLKRKGMVRTQTGTRNTPYILTEVGCQTLAAMRCQP
jgi:DNA-binding MarR family transcriptional regulator